MRIVPLYSRLVKHLKRVAFLLPGWRGGCSVLRFFVYFSLLLLVGCKPQGDLRSFCNLGPERRFFLGGHAVSLELACTPEQQRKGLMYREELLPATGMLFVYARAQVLSFWMKNTPIALDIGFFDAGACLLDVQTMLPVSKGQIPKTYYSPPGAMYAVELPMGWFKKNQVTKGACLRLN